MAAAPQEIKSIGRFEITRVLGKGAMGIVYEGRDPRLNRVVAIKTILTSALDADTAKEYSTRFVREAQAVARMNHPNIVQVFDFGEEGDVAYIVMEFIRGKELKSYFDINRKFSLADTVRMMCELLDALEIAHENGIIHRDIKPANMMIDGQGRVKLTDFGVARVTDVDRTQAERTMAGTVVGTPAYMSPEQITGENVDHRTDLFSAGVVLYQFLTGEKPFTGAGAWTIAKKIMSEDPRKPSEINVSIPQEYDHVINRALAKSADQRYANARQFAEALKRVLAGGPAELVEDKTIAGGALFDPDATLMPPPEDTSGGLDFDLDAPPERSTPNAKSTTSTTSANAALKQPDRSSREAKVTNDAELEFWRSIKDSTEAEDFDLYIQQFPTGLYADLARSKIRRLQRDSNRDPSSTQGQSKQALDDIARKEAEAKARQEAEAQARKEAEAAKARQEAEAKAKREAEEATRKEAEAAKARQEAEAKAKREGDEQARKEAEAAKAKQEAEAKAKREAEENARQDAEAAKAKQETEAKAQREAEEQAREAEAAKAKQEAEAKTKHEADEKARKDAEAAKAKQEAEAKAKREAEEAARQDAEVANAKQEAEAKAKREADEKARKDAEAAKAKQDAEAKAKREADEAARKEAEAAKAKQEAEAKTKHEADEKARKDAEAAKAKQEAEAKAQREADENARKEAEAAKAKQEAEVKAKREADEKARKEAEVAKAKQEAEAKAKREADEKARKDAEAAKAKQEAEAKAKREADEKARKDAEAAKAKQEAEAKAKAKREAEEKARKETEAKREPAPATGQAPVDRAAEPEPAPAPVPAKKSSMAVPAIVGVVVLAAGVGYMMFGGSAEKPSPATVTKSAEPAPKSEPKVDVAKVDPDAGKASAQKREAEEKAAREAAEKTKREAEEAAKREAADKGKRETEDKKKDAAEKTKRETEEKAKRETEDKKKDLAEKAKRETEDKKKDVAEKAKRDAEEKTRQDAAGRETAGREAAAREAAQREAAQKETAAREAAQREAAARDAAQKEAAAREAAARRDAEAKIAAAKAEPPKPAAGAGSLMEQASAAEQGGRVGEAVRLYKQAVAAGSGAAAKRLGDIYGRGAGDVGRDYQESLRFYDIARSRGENVPKAGPR